MSSYVIAACVPIDNEAACKAALKVHYPVSTGNVWPKYGETSAEQELAAFSGSFPDVVESGGGQTLDAVMAGMVMDHGLVWGYVGENPNGGQTFADLRDFMANGLQSGRYVPYTEAL